MKGVLDVALADDAEMSDCLESDFAQPVIFGVGECLRGRDDDALAGVDAHWIEIFHIADRDAIVGAVADDLILDFLQSAQVFLDKHLSHVAEDFGELCDEFFLVSHDSRTFAAERKSRANHDGVPNLPGCRACFFDIDGRAASCGFHADFPELLYKKVAVFGVAYRCDGSTEDFYTVFFENAALFEGESQIERGLSAERQRDGIGTFLPYDLRREFFREWKEVHRVG